MQTHTNVVGMLRLPNHTVEKGTQGALEGHYKGSTRAAEVFYKGFSVIHADPGFLH